MEETLPGKEIKIDQLTMVEAMVADNDRSGSPRSILVAVPMSFTQQTAPLSISELAAPLTLREVKTPGAAHSLACVPAACNYMEVSLPSSTLSSLLNQVYARHHIVPQPVTDCDESDRTDVAVTDTHSEVLHQMEASSALQLNQVAALDENANTQHCELEPHNKCFFEARGLSVRIKMHSSTKKPHDIKYCKMCLIVPATSSGKRPGTARQNRKRFSSIYCKKCLPIAAKSKSEKPKKAKGMKQFKCTSCNRCFSTRNGLKRHEQSPSHTRLCRVCGKSLASYASLKLHLKLHTGEKPYQCSSCGMRFVKSNLLKEHERRHSGDRLVCSYCSKQFLWERSLQQHELRHVGKDKSLMCSLCGKLFVRSDDLEKHEATHRHGAPIRAFKCPECDKHFTTKGNMKIHRRNHTGDKPYKCSYCDKSFIKSSTLKDHLNTHTGDKPHKCMHCGKGFACGGSLAQHVKIHAGEKKFKCKYCDKCFTQSSSRASHEIANHPECGKVRKEN